MVDVVGLGDEKQAVQKFLKHRGVAPEHLGKLAGVGLETLRVFLGDIKDAGDLGFFYLVS